MMSQESTNLALNDAASIEKDLLSAAGDDGESYNSAIRKYKQSNDIGYLEQAITLLQQHLKHSMKENTRDNALKGLCLAQCLLARANVTQQWSSITEALDSAHEVINICKQYDGDNNVTMRDAFRVIANAWALQFSHVTKSHQDIRRAIEAGLAATKYADGNWMHQSSMLCSIGSWYNEEYKVSRQKESLHWAVQFMERALSTTRSKTAQIDCMWRLGEYLQRLHMLCTISESHDLKFLTRSVKIAHDLVKLLVSNMLLRCRALDILGQRQALFFDHDPNKYSLFLDKAIMIGYQVLQHAPANELSLYLNNLGVRLDKRYDYKGDLADLHRSVAVAEKALSIEPEASLSYPVLLENLSTKLINRYQHVHEEIDAELKQSQPQIPRDLARAMGLIQQSITLSKDDPSKMASRLSVYAGMLEMKFDKTEEKQDIDESISQLHAALDLMPSSHLDRLLIYGQISRAYRTRYNAYEKRKEDLDCSIQFAILAVESEGTNYSHLAEAQSDLGEALVCRYERSSDFQDLTDAIAAFERSVSLTAPEAPILAERLDAQASALHLRFIRLGEMASLEAAVSLSQRALDTLANADPRHAGILHNMSEYLRHMFVRTSEVDCLQAAIDASRQAMDATPESDPDYALYANGLGNLLHEKYCLTGDAYFLWESVERLYCSVKASQKHLSRFEAHCPNLCSALGSLFNLTKHCKYLDAAIYILEYTLTLLPEDDCSRIDHMESLGMYLLKRSTVSKADEYRQRAKAWFLKAYRHVEAAPIDRIGVASRCLYCFAYGDVKDLQQGIELGIEALQLIPATFNSEMDIKDQEFIVTSYKGLSSDLCSLLLLDNRIVEAVYYLEYGRNTMLNGMLANRHNPTSTSMSDEDQQNLGLSSQLSQDSFSQMMDKILSYQGRLGYLCFVNSSSIQSDAICFACNKPPTCIKLPEMVAEKAEDWAKTSWEIKLRSIAASMNKKMVVYLDWLWTTCVEPVMHHVRLDQAASTTESMPLSLPRIWWIGCGHASSMPFHAAGSYTSNSSPSAMHNVVSSYTPSIQVLSVSYEAAMRHHGMNIHESPNASILIATMPTTPPLKAGRKGPSQLQMASQESDAISQLASDHGLSAIALQNPSAERVSHYLSQTYVAHFACHGISSDFHPSDSCLIFEKPGATQDVPPQQDRLSAHQLSQLHVPQLRLAYLSACSTSTNKVHLLSDESFHIASMFQLLGVSHVIASFWKCNDSASAEIAQQFYKLLFSTEDETGFDYAVARAIHDATLACLTDNPQQPLLWATFAHHGA